LIVDVTSGASGLEEGNYQGPVTVENTGPV